MKKTLITILLSIFTISLTLFMILGGIIVIVQLFSIITLNGALSVSVYENLRLWTIRLSVIAGFAGFGMSYLRKKQKVTE